MGHLRPELRAARFLGKEADRHPVRSERSMNPPGANYRASGRAIRRRKPSGKGACSES